MAKHEVFFENPLEKSTAAIATGGCVQASGCCRTAVYIGSVSHGGKLCQSQILTPFGHVLTLAVHLYGKAARLRSISAHSKSQTPTRERDHARGSAINDGNHPYVELASFLTYTSAHRYSVLQDPSTCKSIFLGKTIHVTDCTAALNVTTLSIHT